MSTTGTEDFRKKVNCFTAVSGDAFVGFSITPDLCTVTFPIGYRLDDITDLQNKKQNIRNLLHILKKFGTDGDGADVKYHVPDISESIFPIHSFLYLLSDFFDHGYYHEKNVRYKHSGNGKINWSRTIKKSTPIISGRNVVYTNYEKRCSPVNEDSLITRIHEYCVYKSYESFGFIFCTEIPCKPSIKFNKRIFSSVVLSKMAESYLQNDILLFTNMLAVINSIENSEYTYICSYGTNNFEHIWERMIDYTYGESDKKMYFPHAYWCIKGKTENKHALMPDSIMYYNNAYFILDAKYYRYGITYETTALPDTSSIAKQIAYGEYLEKGLGKNPSHIFNAFLLPFGGHTQGNNEHFIPIEYIGYAAVDWKNKEESKEASYLKVKAFLLDIRTLMYTCSRKKIELIASLADCIQKA